MRKTILWLSAALVFVVSTAFIIAPRKAAVSKRSSCPGNITMNFTNNTASYTVSYIEIGDGVGLDSDSNIPGGGSSSPSLAYTSGTVYLEVHLGSNRPIGRMKCVKNGTTTINCYTVDRSPFIGTVFQFFDPSGTCGDVYTVTYDTVACP